MKEYSHSTIDLARRFRRSPTEAEGVLWKHLRGSRLDGLKFKRQHRLGRYIVDFYCAELKLVVEVEGGIHDHDDQREYDMARFNEIESHGLNVLRVKNEDVMNNTEQVLNTILSYRASSTPSANASPSPRIGRRGRGMRSRKRNIFDHNFMKKYSPSIVEPTPDPSRGGESGKARRTRPHVPNSGKVQRERVT